MILTVGGVAAGGACVARIPRSQVVFVRHCLPGETVRVVLTSDGLEVPACRRRRGPHPVAGAGRTALPVRRSRAVRRLRLAARLAAAQLALKTALVEEQLRRVGRLRVGPAASRPSSRRSGWRTRVQWAAGIGFHKHRSSTLELVDRCLIAAPGADVPPGRRACGYVVEVMACGGQRAVAVDGRGTGGLRLEVLGRRFEVAAGGFWQVHFAAPTVLAAAVLEGLAPQPGESVVDLYAGVGLFAALLGDAVGPTGSVLAVEASARACADAARNTDGPALGEGAHPRRGGRSGRWSRPPGRPRRAGPAARRCRARGHRGPCCPAPPGAGLRLLRPGDVRPRPAGLRDAGWAVDSLRALDLFPQTEHVELVTILTPPPDLLLRRCCAGGTSAGCSTGAAVRSACSHGDRGPASCGWAPAGVRGGLKGPTAWDTPGRCCPPAEPDAAQPGRHRRVGPFEDRSRPDPEVRAGGPAARPGRTVIVAGQRRRPGRRRRRPGTAGRRRGSPSGRCTAMPTAPRRGSP